MRKRENRLRSLTGRMRRAASLFTAVLLLSAGMLASCGKTDAEENVQTAGSRTGDGQEVGGQTGGARADGTQTEPVTLVYGSGDYTRINP
ncbi:MAG: hypothetical protein K2N39_09320, partial [Lachnospiraceae bacterium]|nr:hypothetical protein [Lachnospiraceae bacterium]